MAYDSVCSGINFHGLGKAKHGAQSISLEKIESLPKLRVWKGSHAEQLQRKAAQKASASKHSTSQSKPRAKSTPAVRTVVLKEAPIAKPKPKPKQSKRTTSANDAQIVSPEFADAEDALVENILLALDHVEDTESEESETEAFVRREEEINASLPEDAEDINKADVPAFEPSTDIGTEAPVAASSANTAGTQAPAAASQPHEPETETGRKQRASLQQKTKLQFPNQEHLQRSESKLQAWGNYTCTPIPTTWWHSVVAISMTAERVGL